MKRTQSPGWKVWPTSRSTKPSPHTHEVSTPELWLRKSSARPSSPRRARRNSRRSPAFVQADAINRHALEATGGKTYAELDKDDPLRGTAMNGSFLRASLFTSVIAFGVALFAIGVGVLSILLGWGLRLAAPASAPAVEGSAERAAA